MADLTLQPLKHSVLTECSFPSVVGEFMSKALDVMVLGSIPQANRIVSLLYHYNVFTFNMHSSSILEKSMHFAWAQSDDWPSFILRPDPNKPSFMQRYRFGDTLAAKGELLLDMEEEYRRDCWDEGLRNKYPNFDMKDLDAAITMVNTNENPQDRYSIMRPLSQAVELALILGHQSTAEDLLRKHNSGIIFPNDSERTWNDMRAQLVGGRHIWKLFNEGFLAKELSVQHDQISQYVDSMLSTLTQRFENGPHRPFKNNSIKELIDALDETWLDIKPLQTEDSALLDSNDTPIPDTFTHRGLSNQQISAFEQRLDTNLPADFKEFLSLTDGFYHDDPDGLNNLFLPSSHILWEDAAFPKYVPLLEDLPQRMKELFEWPKFQRGLQTGHGTDEGQQYLIEPGVVKAAIREFDRVYESADEGTKRVLERAATDHYGGVEQMRALEWLMLVTFHWDPVLYPYRSFKAYLEKLIIDAEKLLEQVKEEAQDSERESSPIQFESA